MAERTEKRIKGPAMKPKKGYCGFHEADAVTWQRRSKLVKNGRQRYPPYVVYPVQTQTGEARDGRVLPVVWACAECIAEMAAIENAAKDK